MIRGGVLDASLLREDAQRNHAIYGVYGVSVFALRDATVDELAQQPPLVRFDVVFDDLRHGIERLCACEHRTIVNPYHEA